MSNPTVQASAVTFNSGGPDYNASLPASVALGDILVLTVHGWNFGADCVATSTPSGWTKLGSGVAVIGTSPGWYQHIDCFWKVAGSSESAPAIDGNGSFGMSSITRFTNATNVNAYAFSPAGVIANNNDVVCPDVTPAGVVGASVILSVGCSLRNASGATLSYEGGWSSQAAGSFNPPTGAALHLATKAIANNSPDGCTISYAASTVAGGGVTVEVENVPPPPPINTVAPAVTGTKQVGSVLTTDDGTWDVSYLSAAYKWQRSANGTTGWADIAAATATTYTLVHADSGQYIRSSVIVTNAGGASLAAPSAATTVINEVPLNTVAPVVSGTAEVGQTLSCSTGTWNGYPVPTYTYQWQYNDGSWHDIASATASTWLVTIAGAVDPGHTIRCHVTATNSQGSATADSNVKPGVTVLSFTNQYIGGVSVS